MKKTDIERILKQGSVKQKIKLLMTDIAYFNTNGLQTIDIKLFSEKQIIRAKDELLTDKEREMLFNSIKEPKDIEYYNNLRIYNTSFLTFKDKLSITLIKLQALFYLILLEFKNDLQRDEKTVLVNDILDLIPDKKTRDKVLNKAIELTKGDGGIEYQKKGYPKYLDTNQSIFFSKVKQLTEDAIANAKICKEYVITFKTVLNSNLPLKPYKDWVEIQEKTLIKLITLIHEYTIFEGTPTDFPKIELYDKIKAEVTDEDIEDFKNAGI